jgi:DMSO/TMAO reductase YedYZ molybdopterin-dependent catalytic subunit
VDHDNWQLSIDGLVSKPIKIGYEDLLKLPYKTLPVTLECAGNKRALFKQKAQGDQWELGAISHAEWTGVALKDVLLLAEVHPNAVEVAFYGLDKGERKDLPGEVPFARSLPLEKAMHPDTLLVYQMNGQPLPDKHGAPIRLIVPGWYAVASVKWLHRIEVLDMAFNGPFQNIDYVMSSKPNQYHNAKPVTEIQVNSTIVNPTDQQEIEVGTYQVHGIAWAGSNSVTDIQVCADGKNWSPISFDDPDIPYSWRRWSYYWDVEKPGIYTLMVKATDEQKNVQPVQAPWNVKGYLNNSIHTITVHVIQKVNLH